MYGDALTSLPWFSVYGNHDVRGTDQRVCALCSEKQAVAAPARHRRDASLRACTYNAAPRPPAPPALAQYQGHDTCACGGVDDTSGCAQVNPGVGNWVMPALSYYDTRFLDSLGVEIVALDFNEKAESCCEYSQCSSKCSTTLAERSSAARELAAARFAASEAKSLVVFSHYPTDYLAYDSNYAAFMSGLRDGSRYSAVEYFGGHRHNVDQSSTASTAPNDNWLVGGGGGWGCDGGQQGFVTGSINADHTITMSSHIVDYSACCY